MHPSPPVVAPRLIVLRPWMLGVLLLFPAALMWVAGRKSPEAGVVSQPAAPSVVARVEVGGGAEQAVLERRGDWGVMRLTPVTINAPTRLIPPEYHTPNDLYWAVGRLDEAELRQLLGAAGLVSEEQRTVLAGLERRPDGFGAVKVPPDLVRGLTATVRGRLYRELLRLDARNRVVFGNNRWNAARWAELQESLPADVRDVVADFLVPATEGEDVHFWDLSAALHFVPDEAQRIALTRAVNSQRTFLLELQIEPGASINQIAEYWRLPSTRRQFMPMLESLAERPRGSRIDVVHLMPPFVREYVYSYPVSTLNADGGFGLDCSWTCANFERRSGQPLVPSEKATEYLMANYVSYVGRPEFGDIIVLRDEEENAVHVAVHVAADVVFTKNGRHPLMPWVFMLRDEMQRIYDQADPAKTLWVRRSVE